MEPAELARLLAASRRIVALTGAGISTTAGIPDFRGPGGLYATKRYDPEKVFEIGWFRRDPRWFYRFSTEFVAVLASAEPSYTHGFLARLEARGHLAGIVTQNIDGLHTTAGNSFVSELHGSYRSATCLDCGRRLTDLSPHWWQRAMAGSVRPPVVFCPDCSGIIKPDIVFFGERVRSYDAAETLVRGSDLLLVLGSSLNVTPASLLPSAASAPTIIITRGAISAPPQAGWHLVDADLDTYFRQVAQLI